MDYFALCLGENAAPFTDKLVPQLKKLNQNKEISTVQLSGHGFAAYTPNSSNHIFSNDRIWLFIQSTRLSYKGSNDQQALKNIADDYANSKRLSPEHIKGPFTLILYDKTNATLIWGIDKIGQSRLYYSTVRNTIVLGNSLNHVAKSNPTTATLSNQAIFNYIDAHVIPSPQTIYEDIYKQEPSQLSCYKNRKLTHQYYWQPSFTETTHETSADLSEQLRYSLQNAVVNCNKDNQADAFLSGGLDSSSITGYLAKTSSRKINTYTMGFDEVGYDETEYAIIASQAFGTELKNHYVTADDILDAFSTVSSFYDEPFGNSSAIPSYLCAKFAHEQGSTLLLAGDGGDEIFGGNERYTKQYVFEYYNKIPKAIRSYLLEPLLLKSGPVQNIPLASKARSYIEQANTPMPKRMERYNFINHFSAETIFNSDFLTNINPELPSTQRHNVYWRPDSADMLSRMLYMDWKCTLADNDLIKVNSACQLAGIEVRYPMLDDDLIALSTRIPSDWKIKNKQLRHFYKHAMTGFLPDQIINKNKHGFGLPFGEWLKTSPKLQERIYDNLNSIKKHDIIRADFVDGIINTHRQHNAASYYGTMVWILAVLEEWLSSRGH